MYCNRLHAWGSTQSRLTTLLSYLTVIVVVVVVDDADDDDDGQCYTAKEHCVLFLDINSKYSAFTMYSYVHFVKKTFEQVIYFYKIFK